MNGLRLLAICCGSWFFASHVNAQTAPPATALQLGNYSVSSGDVNGDGYADILAKATPSFAIIALDDISFPIPSYASPTFALISNGPTYSLVLNPPLSITGSGVWQAHTHSIAYGDFQGSGITSMMIRSQMPGGDTFTVTTPAGAVQPTLLQRISASDLGIDLGAAGRSIEFRDANRDGRADLTVRTNGNITDVFVADSNGLFTRAADNAGSISAAWNGLRASLDANDVASASGFFSSETRDQYRQLFQHFGSELANLSPRWSGLEQIKVGARLATFLIKQTFNGVTSDYLLTFVLEDGRWVMLEM